jgi:glyoxylase-like metal-dependent hydrolase (beta-lactamase superfamily II)
MMSSRKIGGFELVQIVEFTGPTHDAAWMLPELPRPALEAHAAWLSPAYWIAATNRLVFTMQLWLLKTPGRIILIDTGVGNFKSRPSPYQGMINTPVLDWLEAVGAAPGRVTDVVHTHLHGDHVGWNTRRVDGRWEPTFPNATYHLPRGDWDAYRLRYEHGEHDVLFGAFADSILPVAEAGLTRLFDAGDEVGGVLRATAAPGHSPGQVTLSFTERGDTFIFAGDVLHSPIQVLHPRINSRWCELPEAARTTRLAVLDRAAAGNTTLFPAHAVGLGGWRIARAGGGFAVMVDGEPHVAEELVV